MLERNQGFRGCLLSSFHIFSSGLSMTVLNCFYSSARTADSTGSSIVTLALATHQCHAIISSDSS